MSSPRVEEKRSNKIEKILDASMKIILTEGIAELTMRKLAREMKLTPGALYRYFTSKGDIIALLGQRILGNYTDGFKKGEEEVLERSPSLSPRVRSLVKILVVSKYYWQFSINHYGHYRLLNLMMSVPKQLITGQKKHDKFMATSVSLLQWTASRFFEATTTGALAEGDNFNRSLGLLSQMNGALLLVKFHKEYPELVNPTVVYNSSFRSLLVGWGAENTELEEAYAVIENWLPVIENSE